jgi:hypothetical protein
MFRGLLAVVAVVLNHAFPSRLAGSAEENLMTQSPIAQSTQQIPFHMFTAISFRLSQKRDLRVEIQKFIPHSALTPT